MVVINKQFGKKIKMLRLERGWELAQVAQMLGITSGMYLSLEQGKLSIRLDMLCKLSRIFDVSLAELTRGVEDL